jgi:dTDP-glucose 4,6-dehydratase
MIVRSYFHTYGMNVVTTNCSNNYGPKQHDEKLIPTIIRKALKGENIPIYGDGKNVRDWLYVLDHCKGIELAFKTGKSGETYNIGGNYSCKIGDILKFLVSKSSMKKLIKIKIDKKRLRPIDADLQIPNTKKFQNHYNWKPDIGFEKTMSDLLEYWRDKIRNNKSIYLKR